MKYVKTTHAHVMKGKPEDVFAKMYLEGVPTTGFKERNCINGTFFTWGWLTEDGKRRRHYSSISPLIVEGKAYRWQSAHKDKPQACFIIYKDNTVDMKRLCTISELELYNVKYLWGGVGLVDKRDPKFKYSPSGEGFGTDILRDCPKTVLAYRDGEVFMLTCSMYHSKSGSYDLLDLCKDHDFEFAISLDGGGSTFFKHKGEYKTKGDGRLVPNILGFIDSSEEKDGDVSMSKKVYLDPGHGGSDPGAVGNNLKEKDLALSVSKACETYLKAHGVQVKLSRTGDTYPSITDRAKDANNWGANLVISVHFNSASGTNGDGIEAIHSIHGGESKEFANLMVDNISKLIGQNKRPTATYSKAGNNGKDYFGIIRETKAPAVILECAFINNPNDIKDFNEPHELKALGEALAKSILKHYKIAEKPTTPPTPNPPTPTVTNNRVCAGSYTNLENAENLVKDLRAKGIIAYPEFVPSLKVYRVFATPCMSRLEAENLQKQCFSKGFKTFFVTE